jgi:hypothetical protein
VVEGALQRLWSGPEPLSLKPPGTDRDPRRSPCLPGKAWRSLWQERASRQSFGETSHPGGRSPSRHPRGAAKTAAVAGHEATSRSGTTPMGAARVLAETANSWRRALMQRRAGHDRATTASGGGSLLAREQPVSSSRRRATHSRPLSALLAESECSTRLASKSRVRTPRSHWRCRSNASTLAAYVH